MSTKVITITDNEFEHQVMQAEETVLVYFWAPWCGPCRLMSPLIESASEQYGDRLKVVKMEVDPNPESVAKCKVQGVPALVLFRQGQQLDAIEGVQNKQKLEAFLAAQLTAV